MKEEKVMEVRNLCKKFQGKTVVDNISFQLKKAAILGLLGPNGAGKTTTLKMLTNLCSRDDGEIWINGYSMKDDPGKALRQVGVSLDTSSFYNEMTGIENLSYCAKLYDNIPDIKKRISYLLELVGLSEHGRKKVKNFSLGMRQRLALARSLLANPQIVILDEPANGLDPQGMMQLYELIRNLSQKENITFLVSSHHLHDMENLCTDVLILNQGKKVLYGKTVDLLTKDSKDMIELIIDEEETFLSAIRQMDGVDVMRRQDCFIICRLSGCTLNQFLGMLFQKKITLQYFSMHRKSLQDLFLQMTGGKIQ